MGRHTKGKQPFVLLHAGMKVPREEDRYASSHYVTGLPWTAGKQYGPFVAARRINPQAAAASAEDARLLRLELAAKRSKRSAAKRSRRMAYKLRRSGRT